MPPPLAAFLTFGFIVYCFRRDFKAHPNVTRALWVPFIWTFISSSRAATEWLRLAGFNVGGSLEEGSPVDRFVYIVLIVAGFRILKKRRVRLGELMRNNRWLAAFLIYCLLAILWSDFPFVALKRWIKVIGHPIMVLIIMTEPDPKAAFVALIKRVAYIVLPVSILFIKYYPQFGREFSVWTGSSMFTGITLNKNLMGLDCLIMGYFFVWYFLKTRNQPRSKARRDELILCCAFLLMTAYVFRYAESKTPQTAFFLGVFVLFGTGSKLLNRRMVGTYIVVGLATVIFLQAIFDIYSVTLRMLGRDVTLTDRTLLWNDLLKEPINPLLGAGFESFWLGERIRRIQAKWTFGPNQAHNGYLETYLNLGLIGLVMLFGLLLATYAKARRDLIADFEWGRFRLGFLACAIVYNWTEAAFKTVGFLFFMFYIIAIDLPKHQPALVRRVRAKRPEFGATDDEPAPGLPSENESQQWVRTDS